ncbi:MAG: phytanoyl-CoA dioxygenase family protein, partial [Nannocystaceae bacterium]
MVFRPPLSREHVEQFHSDGFVVVKGLLSSTEYDVLQKFCTGERGLGELQTEVRDTGARTYKVAIWTTLDGTLFGKLPRLPRVVFAAQQLLGEPVYHWHSKVLRKQPGDGSVGIHQDYATWYEDG